MHCGQHALAVMFGMLCVPTNTLAVVTHGAGKHCGANAE
jgi:hypothetical protein